MDSLAVSAEIYNGFSTEISASRDLVAALQDLGSIIIHCGLHEQWSITTLHRHDTIQEGEVLVWKNLQGSSSRILERKKMPRSTTPPIAPCSLFLNQDQNFQAFEYEYDCDARDLAIDETSMARIREAIVSRGLQHHVALSRIPALDFNKWCLVEKVTADSTLLHVAKQDEDVEGSITAGWAFVPDGDYGAAVLEARKCVDDAGIHRVR